MDYWVADKDRRADEDSTIPGRIYWYTDPSTLLKCAVIPDADRFKNSTDAVYLISHEGPGTISICEAYYVAAWHWKESQVILHPMSGAPSHWRIDPPKACYHLWIVK
jgi:hypothetical protein